MSNGSNGKVEAFIFDDRIRGAGASRMRYMLTALTAALFALLLSCFLSFAQGQKSKQTTEQKIKEHAEAYRLIVDSDAVYAHGKWFEISGLKENQPADNGVVIIKCSKAEKLCYDVEATVAHLIGVPALMLSELYVLKWDTTEIVASEDVSAICSRHTLTINFRTRAVTMVDSPKVPLPPSCTGLFGDGIKRANTYSLVATQFPDMGDKEGP